MAEAGAEPPVPPHATVRTATLEIAFEESGDPGGTPVVLLHGYPDDPRCYDGTLAALARRGADRSLRILVPYLRGYGPTRFLDPATPRSGQQAALGDDLRGFLEALDLRGAVLGGMDWGGRAACIVAALWPERVRGLVTVGDYNVQDLGAIDGPFDAEEAPRRWYQWYFHSARGEAALREDPGAVALQCWRMWSPLMPIDLDAFARTTPSFANPDHAAVVVQSYRHRHGAADGDPALEHVERALLAQPRIEVPTISLAPTEDGLGPAGDEASVRAHFGPRFTRRLVGRCGHFLPRERPDLMADAVIELAGA